MTNTVLYRKRIIPNEKILLKDDIIIDINDDVVVTKWNVLTKRHDFTHGASCYFIKDGFKISKFQDDNDNVLYWYCDIIDTVYDKAENTYTFIDLLVDVIVYADGSFKVVDIDEVADALKQKLIDEDIVIKLALRLDRLLNIIYKGKFDDYKKYILNV